MTRIMQHLWFEHAHFLPLDYIDCKSLYFITEIRGLTRNGILNKLILKFRV